MEQMDEETKGQESSCRGFGQIGWGRPQQSQAAGKPGKWPQGRFGQSRKKKIAARLNARRPLPGRRKNSSKS